MNESKEDHIKRNIANCLSNIYKKCGGNIENYVLKVEELERQGVIKSEYIPRANNVFWYK